MPGASQFGNDAAIMRQSARPPCLARHWRTEVISSEIHTSNRTDADVPFWQERAALSAGLGGLHGLSRARNALCTHLLREREHRGAQPTAGLFLGRVFNLILNT